MYREAAQEDVDDDTERPHVRLAGVADVHHNLGGHVPVHRGQRRGKEESRCEGKRGDGDARKCR